MSQSKISRIEKGKVLPTVVDVERILTALEIPAEEGRDLLVLARVANADYISGRAIARVGVWRRQLEIKALLETTSVLRQFLPAMPPGFVQVKEYIEFVMQPTVSSAPDRDIAKAVEARLQSQTVLDDESRQFVLLMTEQAVRWNYAGHAVMGKQAAHLARVAERPNVEISVIPLAAEVHDAPINIFTVFDERLVTVDLFNGGVSFRDPRDITYYLELFEFFLGRALTGDDAIGFLQSVAEEFMRPRD